MKIRLLILLLALLPFNLLAFDFEKLFMPGPVIQGHQKYETECKNCHQRLDETTQRELCLNCHEKVAEDVKTNKGFHGKHSKATKEECRICHTEHQGRKAQIVWLDKDRFNHDETDYKLVGKHKSAECHRCHKPDKKYRETPYQCVNCHKEDDAHDNKLGEECKSCHNPKSWGSEAFDHDKTDFKLNYSHEKAACDLCHINDQFKDTPKECSSCHSIKDVHEGRFGRQCQDCHTEEKWDKSVFKHDRDTKFKIKGKHKRVHCHTCHSVKQSKRKKNKHSKGQKKPRSCYQCHKLDDAHQGKNGEECSKCHNESSWIKTEFDHDKDTEFPLKGAHKKTSCQSCHHSDEKGKKTDKACYSCHQYEDVHDGQEGEKCDSCHNDNSWWMEDVRYDHELSEFPLIGQHAVVSCEACHFSSKFKDAKSECYACHTADDVHKKALGEACENCHNPNDWLIWFFDHDETNFKLEGAHLKAHCHSCHYKPLKKKDDKKAADNMPCIECHNRDDIHSGSFGSDCGTCHNQEDFKEIDINPLRFRKSP